MTQLTFTGPWHCDMFQCSLHSMQWRCNLEMRYVKEALPDASMAYERIFGSSSS